MMQVENLKAEKTCALHGCSNIVTRSSSKYCCTKHGRTGATQQTLMRKYPELPCIVGDGSELAPFIKRAESAFYSAVADLKLLKHWRKQSLNLVGENDLANARHLMEQARKELRRLKVVAHRRGYRHRKPEVINAHRQVYSAVRRRDMVAPDACENCGNSERRLSAHHHDYSRPLDVEWICQPCHSDTHREVH